MENSNNELPRYPGTEVDNGMVYAIAFMLLVCVLITWGAWYLVDRPQVQNCVTPTVQAKE